MQKPASILVATGGAAHSTTALTFAAHLAVACQTDLVVLAVAKRTTDRAQARAILEDARTALARIRPRVRYRTTVRVGHPAEEILREAEAGGYALVVVGERQHHRLVTRFVMGSTAQRVIEHAPCPVVLAKGRIGPVRRILICDSGRPQASLAERVAAQLPLLLESAETIVVLHVMSQMSAGPGIDGHQLRASANELMQEHAPEGEFLARNLQALQAGGYPRTAKVRHGFVVDEILAEAQEGEYDLVLIGAHQGTGWQRILLDDIAHQLIAGLDRPVLIMR